MTQSKFLENLENFPELKGDSFPFMGWRDFRGWTTDTYAAFSAGVFQKVKTENKTEEADRFEEFDMKWFGGRDRFPAALGRLLSLGLTCVCIPPSGRVDEYWYVIRFKESTPCR